MFRGKPIIDVLTGQIPSRRPLWLMRQAGRYLPEYRKVREKAGSFLNLCDDPELAKEVTLQPLRRFDLDAAIVFADILLICRALGCRLEFRDSEGPVLTPVRSEFEFGKLSPKVDLDMAGPVFRTIELVKGAVADHQCVIGFCGAPWTVASYMIEGGASGERVLSRQVAILRPPWFSGLIDRLVDASIDYLVGQVKAGAEVVQIFDSWAGDLPELLCEELIFEPIQRIVEGLNRRVESVPVIGFARGIGAAHEHFAERCGLCAVSVEQSVPLEWLRKSLIPKVPVQGNLDPLVLAAGGEVLQRAVRRITSSLPCHSHIFNLGHGVRPETSVENVIELIAAVRSADGAASG